MAERTTAFGEVNPETVFGRQWAEEAKKYIDDRTQTKNSRAAYAQDLSQFRNFLAEHEVNNWPSITPHLIGDFHKDQKKWYSPATINRRLTAINGFITWLQQETDYPVTEGVDITLRKLRKYKDYRPRSYLEFKPLSIEEVSKLLSVTANIRDKALIHLLRSGLSAQTLHELTMKNVKASADVMDPRMQIGIPDKTSSGNTKTVILDKSASSTLNEYLLDYRQDDLKNPDSPLFALTRQTIWVRVKKYAAKAQINCTPHRLNISSKTLHGTLN